MMKRIDAHQHFWRYDQSEYSWITDSMSELKKDRLPQHILPFLEEFNFKGCIAVQARQTLSENQFLLTLAKDNPWILGVIGWLDLCDQNVEEQLVELKSHNVIKGYRHLIQDETNPDEFMDLPQFNKGVDVVLANNLIYEVLIHENSLAAATRFCARHDQNLLVLDHVGKPKITEKTPKEWEKKIKPLARFQHVHCKLSGLITEANSDWGVSDIEPYIDIALNLFTPERLMFGSDWPVCLLAGKYFQVYQLIEKTIKKLSLSEQEAIWGGNTSKVYKL